MTHATPDVIFKLHGFQPNDFSEEADFYRCQNSRNNIDYITRKKAQDLPKSVRDMHDDIVELAGKSPAKTNIGYISFRPGSTGLFNANKFLTKEEIKKVIKSIRNNEGNVWAGILSFTPELAREICTSKTQAQELLNKHVCKLFKDTGIDYENIEWYGDYHTNTDNPHMHITFFERKPLHITSSGKVGYTTKITLPVENLTGFKYACAMEAKNRDYSFMSLRDPIRDSMKVNIVNDKFHLKNILNLSQSIIEEGHWQYARLSPKNKRLVNDLVKYTLRNFPDTLDKYKVYEKELLQTQASFLSLAQEHNVRPSKEALNFFSSRIQDLQGRLGNTMLQIIRGEVTREDVKRKSLDKLPKRTHNRAYIKASNVLDIPTRELKKLIADMSRSVHSAIIDHTDESFRIQKKIKGELLIYDKEQVGGNV